MELTGAHWRKSTRSGPNDNCVEVADNLTGAQWRKSTRSGNNGNCVEVADNLTRLVGVRDSKDQHGPALIFTPATWATFLTSLK